jgi:regulatory protein
MTEKEKKAYSFILSKAQTYCSYQERCINDVNHKLREWNVKSEVAEKIINQLVDDDFINEERFAQNFAGSKFRIKKWGKNKIIYELKRKGIPDLIIQIGLEEIEDTEYLHAIKELLSKKSFTLREQDPLKRKHKLARYAISKGYRSSLVWDVLNQAK